ncbi:MAG: hypothetical protein CMJ95_11630, partial [Planctomycetes bacterium]|nr:hypothetical protein [Planctomycetota bacterium]
MHGRIHNTLKYHDLTARVRDYIGKNLVNHEDENWGFDQGTPIWLKNRYRLTKHLAEIEANPDMPWPTGDAPSQRDSKFKGWPNYRPTDSKKGYPDVNKEDNERTKAQEACYLYQALHALNTAVTKDLTQSSDLIKEIMQDIYALLICPVNIAFGSKWPSTLPLPDSLKQLIISTSSKSKWDGKDVRRHSRFIRRMEPPTTKMTQIKNYYPNFLYDPHHRPHPDSDTDYFAPHTLEHIPDPQEDKGGTLSSSSDDDGPLQLNGANATNTTTAATTSAPTSAASSSTTTNAAPTSTSTNAATNSKSTKSTNAALSSTTNDINCEDADSSLGDAALTSSITTTTTKDTSSSSTKAVLAGPALTIEITSTNESVVTNSNVTISSTKDTPPLTVTVPSSTTTADTDVTDQTVTSLGSAIHHTKVSTVKRTDRRPKRGNNKRSAKSNGKLLKSNNHRVPKLNGKSVKSLSKLSKLSRSTAGSRHPPFPKSTRDTKSVHSNAPRNPLCPPRAVRRTPPFSCTTRALSKKYGRLSTSGSGVVALHTGRNSNPRSTTTASSTTPVPDFVPAQPTLTSSTILNSLFLTSYEWSVITFKSIWGWLIARRHKFIENRKSKLKQIHLNCPIAIHISGTALTIPIQKRILQLPLVRQCIENDPLTSSFCDDEQRLVDYFRSFRGMIIGATIITDSITAHKDHPHTEVYPFAGRNKEGEPDPWGITHFWLLKDSEFLADPLPGYKSQINPHKLTNTATLQRLNPVPQCRKSSGFVPKIPRVIPATGDIPSTTVMITVPVTNAVCVPPITSTNDSLNSISTVTTPPLQSRTDSTSERQSSPSA